MPHASRLAPNHKLRGWCAFLATAAVATTVANPIITTSNSTTTTTTTTNTTTKTVNATDVASGAIFSGTTAGFGVDTFRGIRYAEVPRRFAAAELVQYERGQVYDASKVGAPGDASGECARGAVVTCVQVQAGAVACPSAHALAGSRPSSPSPAPVHIAPHCYGPLMRDPHSSAPRASRSPPSTRSNQRHPKTAFSSTCTGPAGATATAARSLWRFGSTAVDSRPAHRHKPSSTERALRWRGWPLLVIVVPRPQHAPPPAPAPGVVTQSKRPHHTTPHHEPLPILRSNLALLNGGFVVVSINYRLGPLGFLCVDETCTGGLNGILDQVYGPLLVDRAFDGVASFCCSRCC
jgi:hypothetical protein